MPKKSRSKSTRKKLPIDIPQNTQDNIKDSYEQILSKKVRSFQIRKRQTLEILNSSTIPQKLLFRQSQMKQILQFINKCMEDNKKQKIYCKVLMITGSPGSGKTVSVNKILKDRKQNIIKINANSVKKIRQIHQILVQQLLSQSNGSQLSALQIVRQLEKKYKGSCILYIQQIQLLYKNFPDIYGSQFFTLFTNSNIKLMLIGTSNTIDALYKYSNNIHIQLPTIKNIVYQPYNYQKMKSIFQQKIQKIQQLTQIKILYPQKLLIYSVKKLQSTCKGDLRYALQFLKLVISSLLTKYYNPNVEVQQLTISIISQIFQKIAPKKDDLISSLPFQQQVILIAIHSNMKRTDALEIPIRELIDDIKWIYQSLGMDSNKIFHKKQFRGIQQLQQYGIITKRTKNNQIRVCLKISLGQVSLAFLDHPLLGKLVKDSQQQKIKK